MFEFQEKPAGVPKQKKKQAAPQLQDPVGMPHAGLPAQMQSGFPYPGIRPKALNRGQVNPLNSGGAVVQMVRKRVFGLGDIKKADLFYDKTDGKYYHDMKIHTGYTANTDLNVRKEDYDRFSEMETKDRSPQTKLLIETEDNHFAEGFEKSEAVGSETASLIRGKANSKVTPGTEKTDPPPAIRLYAEGNMAHADTLAVHMTDRGKYSSFFDITGEPEPAGETKEAAEAPQSPAALIKATEFESRKAVELRYVDDSLIKVKEKYYENGKNAALKVKEAALKVKKEEIEIVSEWGKIDENGQVHVAKSADTKKYPKKFANNQFPDLCLPMDTKNPSNPSNNVKKKISDYIVGYDAVMEKLDLTMEKLESREAHDNLEASYGGKTGDLSAASKPINPSKRQYDLIQATFFWLPDEKTKETVDRLVAFAKNKYHKLKEGGKLRITLSHEKGGSVSDSLEDKSKYTKAAIEVKTRLDSLKQSHIGGESKLFEVLLKDKDKLYADILKDRGLNDGEANGAHRFDHTQTRNGRKVDGGSISSILSDHIIEAVRKPLA